MKVPAGLTSVCQPADVAWMKPFNELIRSRWVDTLMDQPDRLVPESPFKFVMPQLEDMCDWIVSITGRNHYMATVPWNWYCEICS
jgi:hypothetical protein